MAPEDLWDHPKLLELEWKEIALALYALHVGDGWRAKAEAKFNLSTHAVYSVEFVLNDVLGKGWDRPAGEDPESIAYFEKTLAEYPKKQPSNPLQSVPPSSPKSKNLARWNHWVNQKHIKPAILYLAVWHYLDSCKKNGWYCKAMLNFLSPSAKLVPEHLDWAREYYAKHPPFGGSNG